MRAAVMQDTAAFNYETYYIARLAHSLVRSVLVEEAMQTDLIVVPLAVFKSWSRYDAGSSFPQYPCGRGGDQAFLPRAPGSGINSVRTLKKMCEWSWML